MKDEEKAIEIANKEKKYYGNPQYEMRDENWSVHECYKSAIQAMKWKDEQHNEEKRDLLGLVKMLKIDERNQTIIEDLVAILNS